MSNRIKRVLIGTGLGLLSMIVSVVGLGYWVISLLPEPTDKQHTQPSDLPYTSSAMEKRGKILIVVSSADKMGNSGKDTGYELTELARPYYVFQANGFEVDIASPKGGEPPAIIDWEDMAEFDFAFLNDEVAQQKVKNSFPVDSVKANQYEAVFFAGGKAAMYDFPDHEGIQALIRTMYEDEKVIGAVCHGPAALVNVQLSNGRPLIDGKRVCSFTNDEELFLIPEAATLFPFLLQDKMASQGADFLAGATYLENVVVDGRLVTGQNPWSTWKAAEAMISNMGYELTPRTATAEEGAIDVLVTYEKEGYWIAKQVLKETMLTNGDQVESMLLAMHGMVAAMKWNLGMTIDMIRLLSCADQCRDLES